MEFKLPKLFIKNVKKELGSRSNYWLAKESKLSESTLSRVMSGGSSPSLETVEAVAIALEVTPASLISEDEVVPIVVEKKFTHSLDAGQTEAIKSILREMKEQEELEDPLIEAVKINVPRDVLEALANQKQDWNFVRASLDIPEIKETKRGSKGIV